MRALAPARCGAGGVTAASAGSRASRASRVAAAAAPSAARRATCFAGAALPAASARRATAADRSARLDVSGVIPMLQGDASQQLPPDLPSYLFKERIVYLVRPSRDGCALLCAARQP